MPIDPQKEPVDTIAVVGIGDLCPGSESIERFWTNILESVDPTSDVPAGGWLIDPAQAFDPRIALADHVHSIRGGFIAIPPVAPDGLDLHFTSHGARQAWRDARTEPVDRDRVGVVFGNSKE